MKSTLYAVRVALSLAISSASNRSEFFTVVAAHVDRDHSINVVMEQGDLLVACKAIRTDGVSQASSIIDSGLCAASSTRAAVL